MSEGSYSFSLTTFSPSGKLLQIEYALNAVQRGQTALGISAANGVVLATEKKLGSSLIDATDFHKIEMITPSIGIVYSGMGPDFRVLVRRSRKKALEYFRKYQDPISVRGLTQAAATVMQEFTQSGGVRPFGVSLLIAGVDHDGPQMYQVDPSGAYFGWKASAIGKNFVNAKTFLEKRHNDEMELEDAIHTALLTLKEGFEGEMTENNIELAVVSAEGVFRVLKPSEVKDYLEEAE